MTDADSGRGNPIYTFTTPKTATDSARRSSRRCRKRRLKKQQINPPATATTTTVLQKLLEKESESDRRQRGSDLLAKEKRRGGRARGARSNKAIKRRTSTGNGNRCKNSPVNSRNSGVCKLGVEETVTREVAIGIVKICNSTGTRPVWDGNEGGTRYCRWRSLEMQGWEWTLV